MSRAPGSPLAAVAGTVAPGFEPVREAFAEAVASQHPATGAALAATHDGRLVVDLWAGATNAAGMPWQEDTLCVLFSGTKGVVASAMLWLADRRELRLTDRVSDHWIEFGASGKADITIAQLCAHAAGLPWIDQALDAGERGDLPRLAALLAAQGPVVEMGRPCYHAITFGWLTTASPGACTVARSPSWWTRCWRRRSGSTCGSGLATTPPRPVGWRGCTAARATR